MFMSAPGCRHSAKHGSLYHCVQAPLSSLLHQLIIMARQSLQVQVKLSNLNPRRFFLKINACRLHVKFDHVQCEMCKKENPEKCNLKEIAANRNRPTVFNNWCKKRRPYIMDILLWNIGFMAIIHFNRHRTLVVYFILENYLLSIYQPNPNPNYT